MELEIKKKILNPLLSRIEIEGIAFSENTPSYDEAKKELADQLEADAGLIVIKNIYQKYGQFSSLINAFVYNNIEAMKKFEKAKKDKKTEEVKEQSKK